MHLPLNGPGRRPIRRRRWVRTRGSRRSGRARAPGFRAWRTIRSTTATCTSSVSIRTGTSIRTTPHSSGGSRRPVGDRRDVEVRRLPSSAVQRRQRALRGAAHARARAAVRGARRRHRAERPRAQLPAAAAAPLRTVRRREVGRPRREGSARARHVHRSTASSTASPHTRPTASSTSSPARAASISTTLDSPTIRRAGRTPTTDNVDYVVKMVTDRHSFSVFDVDGPRLTMTQIDEAGAEIDRIIVTKSTKRQTSAARTRRVNDRAVRPALRGFHVNTCARLRSRSR